MCITVRLLWVLSVSDTSLHEFLCQCYRISTIHSDHCIIQALLLFFSFFFLPPFFWYIVKIELFHCSVKKMDIDFFLVSSKIVLVLKKHKKDLIYFSCFLPVNVPSTVMEAMSRQDTLQPFNKSSKLSPATPQRSVVFPQTPCSRNFSLLDKSGSIESGFNQISVKNQRVLASPTSTSQLNSEFSDWHLWKCGQCFKTFTQRILLQMHVCTQNPDR